MVCENFAREAREIISSESFDDVLLKVLSARCTKPIRPEVVSERVQSCVKESSDVTILGGTCIAGLLYLSGAHKYCRLHHSDLCFSFLVNRSILDRFLQEGAYLMTPGWLSRWRKYIEDWGFTQESARPFFRESASRLVLLDTGIDSRSERNLKEFADFLNLPFHIESVGLDFLRLYLTRIVLEWRVETRANDPDAASPKGSRKLADYAMVLDIIQRLATTYDERRVIESIIELFTLLCAPQRVTCLSMIEGKPGEVHSSDLAAGDLNTTKERLACFCEDYGRTDSGKGFVLRIGGQSGTLGVLEVEDVAFPQYMEHYLNLAFNISGVCSLAISNARVYRKLEESLEALRRMRDELEARVRQRTAELAETNEALRSYTANLERSNRKLMDFAYIAVHDLQEPLRKIRTFADRLKGSYAGLLDEKGLDWLHRMEGSAKRMQDLVYALNEYSRATRDVEPFSRVDLTTVVGGVLDDMELLIEETGARVEIRELPVIDADENQMRILFRHLIVNALKYRSPAGPVINIYGTNGTEEPECESDRNDSSEGFCRIFIEDNGIGFDEKYLDRIFSPFRQLHCRGKYEGTGIGLSICREIVDLHNGSITARSAPGQGTAFIIMLPLGQGEADK